MQSDDQTASEIIRAIDEAAEAFEQRDMARFLDLFAPDADVVMYGTGRDEKCLGREEIRRAFERAWAQSESASFQLGWRSISSAGPVAWVAADATVRVEVEGRVLTEDLRITFVFERRDDRWLCVQSHDSLPAAGQEEGRSFAISQMRPLPPE